VSLAREDLAAALLSTPAPDSPLADQLALSTPWQPLLKQQAQDLRFSRGSKAG